MPGEDGTGPIGQGPLTGRGLGPCGRGLGLRRGRGRRYWYTQPAQTVTPTKEEQVKILEAERADIEAEITDIKEGLKQITEKIQELKGKK